MAKVAAWLPVLLCLALPLAAQDKIEKDFKEALELQNERELERVCRAIVQLGHADGAKMILSAFAKPNLEPDVYWILVRAASAFQSSNGLGVVSKYVVDNKSKPVARDICMGLHNNFSGACEEAMGVILAGGSEELRVSALDHLMDIGKKPAITATVELLRKEGERLSPPVKSRCCRLMQILCKQDFGDSISNWIGWWDANKDKWGTTAAPAGGASTTTLGNSRQNEYDKLKEAKILVIRAGDKCKCKKNHDLDQGIFTVLRGMSWTTEDITKDKFENDPTVTEAWLKQYIAIICICTHIREHCACPTCKPGGNPNMRLYQ